MNTNLLNSPVYPIPPSFNDDGSLDLDGTKLYLDFLLSNGVESVMTTAGTSQFNLLSESEILSLNKKVISSGIKNKIIGIPEGSLEKTIDRILEYSKITDCALMLLFPERHYSDSYIVDFFKRCSEVTKNPLLIHGMWLRSAKGGNWDYTPGVIDSIAAIPNFIGMKEETSEIGKSFGIISEIKDKDFQIILAGGSQKRHWFSGTNRDCTFLSGIGSIWPDLDKKYINLYKSGDLIGAKNIISNYETPVFEVFMKHGWHYSMRKALQIKGFIRKNRIPFPESLGDHIDQEIEIILQKIDNKLQNG